MQGNKLYVGNFSYSATDEQLEKLFSPYGKVAQINIIGNKGFAFIEMGSSEEAQKAKEALDGSSFDGRTLRVDEARPQTDRPARSNNSSYRRY
ncbi:MAG: RNA-binding protein [Actinobacteria bacterium]|nr:RNA-binding protein [Actinomycetota bacterium]